jgi:hypothetical protein
MLAIGIDRAFSKAIAPLRVDAFSNGLFDSIEVQ